MNKFINNCPQIKYVPKYQDIIERVWEVTIPEEYLPANADYLFTPKEIDQILPRYAD